MFRVANELQKAFLAKEEAEKLLLNLEELKSEGSISDEQYHYLKKDYSERVTAADSAVAQQRVELKSRLADSQTSLANNKLELDRLGLRFKVGELPLEKYERLDRKMRKRVSKTEGEIAELERLLKVNSSSDLGILPTELGRQGARAKGFSIPEPSSFTAFVNSVADVASPRTRLLGLIGGLFLFISVFMPWASVGAFGISVNLSGADLSGHLAAAGIICGLLAIGAAFLAKSETKGFVHIMVGAISLLVFLIFGLRSLSGPDFGELGLYGGLIEEMLEGMITTREGLVFYIMAAIAVICGGVLERREG